MNAWARVGRGAGGVARERAWGASGAWVDVAEPVGSILGVASAGAGAAVPSPNPAAAEATAAFNQ